jgi:hypothetical protein
MKIYLLLGFSCFLTACQTQTTPVSPPVFTPPAGMSAEDLKWNLREVLRLQLPLTFPEQRGGQDVKKSYSFDLERGTDGEKTMWVIPEKLYAAANDSMLSGGKYFIPLENIEPSSVQWVLSEDQTRIALVIRAKPNSSFVHHPFSLEPDKALTTVALGWWDRRQDLTIGRAAGYMKALLTKMLEEPK